MAVNSNPAIRLLVIDDSSDDVELLRWALQPLAAVDITRLENGQSAMEWLDEHHDLRSFDLILIDWRLPSVSGDEVAKAFRKREGVDEIPVAVSSTAIPPELTSQLVEEGVFVLEKPIDLDGYQQFALRVFELLSRTNSKANRCTIA